MPFSVCAFHNLDFFGSFQVFANLVRVVIEKSILVLYVTTLFYSIFFQLQCNFWTTFVQFLRLNPKSYSFC